MSVISAGIASSATTDPSDPSSIPLTITTKQVFSKRALGYLWSKREELDPGQVSILNSMYNNRKRGQIEGTQVITYKLSKSLAGRLGYGRLYGTIGSLETLEKECRGTLCKDLYDDLDIKNCHPVLLVQFAKRYGKDLSEVQAYVEKRDEILRSVSENRDAAKQEVIRIFYGGRTTILFLQPMQKEVREFTKFLIRTGDYDDLYKAVSKEDNVYGTFLSYILQTEERKCMLEMKRQLELRRYSVDVLAYDGVMVRKNPDVPITDCLLRELERSISDVCAYQLVIENKAFVWFDIPVDLATANCEVCPRVPKKEYLEKKELFEEAYFYFSEKDAICEIQENGSLKFFSLQHARTYLNTWDFIHGSFVDRTSFLDIWLKDPSRRVIKNISIRPSSDPFTYVQALQFAYSATEPPSDAGKYLAHWQSLLDIVAGYDDTKKGYLEKYLAHCIQKPFERPDIALVVTGQKRIGKDTLFDFFMDYVVGSALSHNYTTTEQFWDKYDTARMNKIFIKLEEAVGHLNKRNEAAFKARITSKDQTFNPKGVQAITCDNFNRYVLTTNETNPVVADERFVFFAASPRMKMNAEFFGRIRQELFTPEGGAAVGYHLNELDISGFNARFQAPHDDFQTEVLQSEKTSEELFIAQWDGVEKSSTELYGLYKDFCMGEELPFCKSVFSFGIKLLPFLRDGVIHKKVTMVSSLYYKKRE